LDATGLTSEEWAEFMNGTYGCLMIDKIGQIESTLGMESGTLQAASEVDGCSYEATEDMSALHRKVRMAQVRKELQAEGVLTFEIAKPNADQVKLGVLGTDTGLVVYISDYDGSAWQVDADLWPCDSLPAGTYSLVDGRTFSVVKIVEVFNQGTNYEWEYEYSIIDWANSQLTAEDLLPWVKEQLDNGIANAVEMTKVEMTKVADGLSEKITALEKLSKDKDSEIATLKTRVAKLSALPGRSTQEKKLDMTEKSDIQKNKEVYIQRAETLRKQHGNQ